MGAFPLVRGLIFGVGAFLVLGGFAAMASDARLALGGLWLVAMGGFMMVVAVLERRRYRSETAEAANDAIGPGGGETPGPIEARFRPTDEVFLDPTTGQRMRVVVDPRSGERRYVAEA